MRRGLCGRNFLGVLLAPDFGEKTLPDGAVVLATLVGLGVVVRLEVLALDAATVVPVGRQAGVVVVVAAALLVGGVAICGPNAIGMVLRRVKLGASVPVGRTLVPRAKALVVHDGLAVVLPEVAGSVALSERLLERPGADGGTRAVAVPAALAAVRARRAAAAVRRIAGGGVVVVLTAAAAADAGRAGRASRAAAAAASAAAAARRAGATVLVVVVSVHVLGTASSLVVVTAAVIASASTVVAAAIVSSASIVGAASAAIVAASIVIAAAVVIMAALVIAASAVLVSTAIAASVVTASSSVTSAAAAAAGTIGALLDDVDGGGPLGVRPCRRTTTTPC